MYHITQYSYDRADDLGVYIKPSKHKNKKIDVFDGNHQFICSIGDKRYKDFPTYYKEEGKEYAKYRQQQYWIRHRKDANKWGTPGYYAACILW
jgi:hypothetical protein